MPPAAQQTEAHSGPLHVSWSGSLSRDRSPLALWHLLSLDAPTVAVIWTVFVGWCAGLAIPPVETLAMFLAVWILYAADRLFDTRPLLAVPSTPELEERHYFHHRHRAKFVPAILLAALLLIFLLQRIDPAALRLYLLLAILLGSWLLLVHAGTATTANTRCLPKEVAVGLFFPAAVFIPTLARTSVPRASLLLPALLFAGLCTLNCLFLYTWEHPAGHGKAHATTRWALAHLPALVFSLALASALSLSLSLETHSRFLPGLQHRSANAAACLLSTGLLLLLHRLRGTLSPLRLRAWADFVLLAPLVVFLFSALRQAHP